MRKNEPNCIADISQISAIIDWQPVFWKDGIKRMIEDIEKLRPQVDILMVSFHWGIHFVPAVIAYYQRYAAHFAIDAGADIILGHHEHINKPIEIYHGKVITYGMANFGLEGPEAFFEGKGSLLDSESHKAIAALNPDAQKKRRTMSEEQFISMALKVYIEDKKIVKVTYLPVQCDMDTHIPHFVKHDDPDFLKNLNYMIQITESQNIVPHFHAEGDEIVIAEMI